MDMETGEIAKMSIMPTTYQRPHPPIWQVIDTPRSIKWAAEHQVNGIFWMPTVKRIKETFLSCIVKLSPRQREHLQS
ncbi:hypothetical protein GCM10020331_087760 [Ectobacillus funiculus]